MDTKKGDPMHFFSRAKEVRQSVPRQREQITTEETCDLVFFVAFLHSLLE